MTAVKINGHHIEILFDEQAIAQRVSASNSPSCSDRISSRAWLIRANAVRTAQAVRDRLAELGFSMAIYPLTLLYAAADAMGRCMEEGGEVVPWNGEMTFPGLCDTVGFND